MATLAATGSRRTNLGHERASEANRGALNWLNFFLADVKDGIGPFLAIFLTSSQHWDPGRAGIVNGEGAKADR
jgi:hypothetical protein